MGVARKDDVDCGSGIRYSGETCTKDLCDACTTNGKGDVNCGSIAAPKGCSIYFGLAQTAEIAQIATKDDVDCGGGIRYSGETCTKDLCDACTTNGRGDVNCGVITAPNGCSITIGLAQTAKIA